MIQNKFIPQFLLFVLFSGFCYSQDYYFFKYKGKDGLLNADLEEVLKPEYYFYRESKEFRKAILSKDKKTVVVDLNTFESKEYDSYDFYEVFIEDEPFSLAREFDGKNYLKNENTGEILNLSYKYYSFQDLNEKYIVANYKKPINKEKLKREAEEKYKKEVAEAKRKGLTIPPPTIVEEPMIDYDLENYLILKNNKSLPSVLKIDGYEYVLIKSSDKIGLSYIAFTVSEFSKKYKVYELENMKMIQSFELPKNEGLIDFLSKRLNKRLDSFYPTVAIADAPNTDGFRVEENNSKYILKKELDDGTFQAILSSKHRINYRNIKQEKPWMKISISTPNNWNALVFKFNPETKFIALPQKYIEEFDLQIIE